jgi:site-specific recombinase XerD
MASFSIRKVDGRYYARISEKGRDPRRKSWPLQETTKQPALMELNRLQQAYHRGEWDPWEGGWLKPDPIDLSEAIDLFLDAKSHLQPRTLDTYEGVLERFADTLRPSIDVQDLTAGDLQSYIRATGISQSTKRKRYGHLRTFFNWMLDTDRLDASPLEKVDQPKKEEKEPVYLDREDVKRLMRAIRAHMETTEDAAGRTPDLAWLQSMIPVAVCTGLRRGELVALQWEDVDLAGRCLYVRHRGEFRTKGNRERRVPLRGDAEDVMRGLRMDAGDDPSGHVFTDRSGEPIRRNRVSKRFKHMARKAKLDERVHFHSLRHTTGSWLAMRGVPIQQIQAILGHSDTSITERYSHLAPDTLDTAMEETFGD